MHEQDLHGIVDALQDMTGRFVKATAASAPDLTSTDRAAFKRLMLEAKSMLDSDLGHLNDFSMPLGRMANLPGYGLLNPLAWNNCRRQSESSKAGSIKFAGSKIVPPRHLAARRRHRTLTLAVLQNCRILLSRNGTRADSSGCCRS